MGEMEKEILSQVIEKTDSVLILFFIVTIIFLVVALIPIYKLVIKNRANIADTENNKIDKSIKREALIIDVITKNTEVISGLKMIFENTLDPSLSSLENKVDDILLYINKIDSKIEEISSSLKEIK